MRVRFLIIMYNYNRVLDPSLMSGWYSASILAVACESWTVDCGMWNVECRMCSVELNEDGVRVVASRASEARKEKSERQRGRDRQYQTIDA